MKSASSESKTPTTIPSMHKHIFSFLIALVLCLGLATSCGKKQAVIPTQGTAITDTAQIYPDYRDIVIPPNIAPLNFQVKSAGDEFVGCIEGAGKRVLAAADADGKLMFDSLEWRGLLQAAKGKDLQVTIYARRGESWVKFPAYKMTVAEEPIDRYLSYRLIEPSYELYRQLGLYQRDLESFDVQTIYENNRKFDLENNHCVNCHNYQNYSTRRMLFHVRGQHGGTMFVEDGKAQKMNMKTDSVLSSSVYPTWHPTRNWVVFSSNQTGQVFHMTHGQKLEVLDYGSDLVFYDADNHTLTNILKTVDDLETFPCWAPDGKKLFYTSAHVEEFKEQSDSARQEIIPLIYNKVRYDLMSLTFDEQTRTFGPPTMEFPCSSLEKSAAVPRVSPDGRYVLFTLADYGQFHIWHESADLYVKDLQQDIVYPLEATNSKRADSYHTWSSNGRWVLFCSRRDDGSYTRIYIAYFDKTGHGHKAFLLPQEDPEQNVIFCKSYNVPELTRDAVRISEEELRKCVMDDKNVKNVTYRKK